MSLQGKRIVVTGAASGIGAASARQLREKGAYVIGVDRNDASANCDEYVKVNLANEESIQAAAAQIGDNIDGVCNVAGVPPTAPVSLVLQVNVIGLRKFTEAMIPHMKKGGTITNVSSVAGFGWSKNIEKVKKMLQLDSMSQAGAFAKENGLDDTNAYQFSKECITVHSLKSWNAYPDKGIRTNIVSPGPVDTPILDDFEEKMGKGSTQIVPKPATADQIAQAVVFLADPGNSWINGLNLFADGGLSAALQGRIHGF